MSNESTAGFRLSLQQKYLWVRGYTGSVYRSTAILRLQGPLDVARLRGAVASVIDRHEILRTTFQRQPGMKIPLQIVHESMEPLWHEVDDEDDQEDRLSVVNIEASRRAFDPEHGPLVDLTLLRVRDEAHFLLLNISSLCADAPTIRYLTAEIAHFYGSGSSQIEIEDDPIQYADYAEWQHELLQSRDDAAVADRAYWREQNMIDAPVLSLSFDEPRANHGAEFTPVYLAVSLNSLWQDLLARSSQMGCDPHLLVLTCWGALLGKLTGEDTLTIGYRSSGRNHPDIKRAVGPFARTLPLVLSIDDAFSLRDLAERVAVAVQQAETRQDRYAPDDVSSTDLLIGFEPREAPVEYVVDGLTIVTMSILSYGERIAINLLPLYAYADSGLLHLQFDAMRWIAHHMRIAPAFELLVRGAIENPDIPMSRLDIIGEEEGKKLLQEFASRPLDYPRGKLVHKLFEEQVERTPDAIAVVSGETAWSFSELNARANRLAAYLVKQGLRKGSPVGLLVDRSADMIAAMLGIMKAGGAYLPLHLDHPPLRLQTQLEQAGATLVVTEELLADRLPEFTGTLIARDRDADMIAKESSENLPVDVDSNDPAYVIYTSGSTGTPKGVVVTHGNLASYTYAVTDRLHLKGEKEQYSFALLSSITADLGNTSIYPSLLFGGCLHIISHETSIDGVLFSRYLAEHPVDVMKITPSHLGALIGTGGIENVLPRRLLVMGGEALSGDLAGQILSLQRCDLANHYGPTEATVGVLTTMLRAEDAERIPDSATVSLGHPLGNSEVYILDRHLKPLPIGGVGEIYIGGEGVAAGYVNQSAETAERFIPHPFSTEPDARLYRTGDRARYSLSGAVEFLGRIDSQVKLRGYRVELREIEEALKGHSGVDQVAVVLRDEEGSEGQLVAYVVPSSTGTFDSGALRTYAAERLPEYMLPSSFTQLDRLPLSPNGKLDRRALPSPGEENANATESFVAPRTPYEERLAEIWRGVLRLERVGIHDNFFSLGGHSLLATQIVAQARSAFQVELPLRSIFESPTVAAMAAVIGESASTASADEDIASLLDDLENLSEEEARQLLEIELKRRGDST